MTDPVVRIEPTRVVVEPGGQSRVTVTVRNTGQIVEGFRLTVHGAAADWAEVLTTGDAGPEEERGVVRVDTGQEGSATIVFTGPPASAGVAGEVPFCVLAQSVVDPDTSAAAEGDLAVGQVDGLTGSLTPVTSTGRWSGRHTVKISNWGNAPASLRLIASDPDEALGFLVHPDRLRLPVGASAVAAVRVRSRRPFLRGTRVRLPFRVVAEPDPPPEPPVATPAISDPRRPVLDGALDQWPVLSKGTVMLAALGVVALAAAVTVAVTATPAPAAVPHLSSAVAPPQQFSATALDATSVHVAWKPFPREPSEVHVFRIDPATQDQQIPVTDDDIQVKGSQAGADVKDLKPDTQVCFQAATVRGKTQSLRSEPACAQTQAPAEASTSAGGSGSGAGGSQGSPTASGSASGASTSGTPTSTATTSPTTTTPSGTASGSAATSSSTSSSASRSGLPDFGDRWVLAPYLGPAIDPSSKALAQQYQDQFTGSLKALGRDDVAAGQLDSAHYPGLRFARQTIVVYVGTFPTREDAQALCPDLKLSGSLCVALQPGTPT